MNSIEHILLFQQITGDEEKDGTRESGQQYESPFFYLNLVPSPAKVKSLQQKYFVERYDDSVYIDTLKPVDLLAHKLHTSICVDLKQVKSVLDDFIHVMA